MSAAFRITTDKMALRIAISKEAEIEGSCNIPGTTDDNDSTRSEIGGIYAIVTTVEQVAKEHDITEGAITIGCDNESSLWMCLSPRYRTSPDSAHFDLVSATRTKIAKLPIEFKSHWIKGHQDEKKSKLDQWEEINVDMDELAKRRRRREEQRKTPIRPGPIEGELWPIKISGSKVVSRARVAIMYHCQRRRAQQYWCAKRARHGEPAAQPKVDRKPLAKASKQVGMATRVWKVKHATGHCGVAERMKKRNQWPTEKCLDCGQTETVEHVWRCRGRDARWQQAIKNVAIYLRKAYTDQTIAETFILTLRYLRRGHRPPAAPTDRLRKAIRDQRRIGLHRTILGELSIHWRKAQHHAYKRQGSRRSSGKWTRGLIISLIRQGQSIWNERNEELAAARAKDPTLLDDLDLMITDQHRIGGDELPGHRQYLFDRPLTQILQQPPADRRQWLVTTMTAREYAARQQGESSSARGERRTLRRWTLSRQSFHLRLYERVMGRTREQMEESRRLRPWRQHNDPAATIRRPEGRTQRLSNLATDAQPSRTRRERQTCPTCGGRDGETHEASNNRQCHTCDATYPLRAPANPAPPQATRNSHRKQTGKKRRRSTSADPHGANHRRTKSNRGRPRKKASQARKKPATEGTYQTEGRKRRRSTKAQMVARKCRRITDFTK